MQVRIKLKLIDQGFHIWDKDKLFVDMKSGRKSVDIAQYGRVDTWKPKPLILIPLGRNIHKNYPWLRYCLLQLNDGSDI